MQKNSNQMTVDWYIPEFGVIFRVKKKVFEKQTKYQKIEIYETEKFGKVLFIDGAVQSVEKGEESYHEVLVHPALFAHPSPERVLIIGGGEGATLREVLKHPVKEVKMVDIDEEMIKVAKEYLKFDRGAFEDERAELIIGDGLKYVKEEKGKYDVIIVDATDPGATSNPLYTEEFYSICYEKMNQESIFITQGGNCIFLTPEKLIEIYKMMKSVFDKVKIYTFPIVGLVAGWSFISGIKGNIEIEKNFPMREDIKLEYFNPEKQKCLFSLPLFFEKLLYTD
ncbi:polyamine aminopropyltransferase [bacterium]|nr:polyamine aminopropyltransferase [bacterium]